MVQDLFDGAATSATLLCQDEPLGRSLSTELKKEFRFRVQAFL